MMLTAASATMSQVQKRVDSGFSFSSILPRILQMNDETIRFELNTPGQRLDAALSEVLPDTSRAQIQNWIKQGLVTDETGKALTQGSLKLKQPINVIVKPPQKQPFALPQPSERSGDLDIIFEDEHLLVVNKPVGLTVHPGAGRHDGTLVNMLLGHTGGKLSDINTHERPGIIHRLDKDTSGLLMVAKTNRVHVALAEALQRRDIQRHYQALVWGLPQPLSGTIDAPIGRDPKNRQRQAIISSGKHAVTHYKVLGAMGMAIAHVACKLETGRTHQIRVHMTSIGHPLLGDKTYNGRVARKTQKLPEKLTQAIEELPGQALFAAELVFTHPITGEQHHFVVPTPPYFQKILDLFGEL